MCPSARPGTSHDGDPERPRDEAGGVEMTWGAEMEHQHDPVALSGAERRAFDALVDQLAVDDPVFAARMQTRAADSRWYTWARRRNRRLGPNS
jgi:hypothetical protein